MTQLKLLDLFSGIGGFSLGLERSGYFKTVAFCEIEEFPRKVLKKHWPEVPQYHDVRELTAARLAADGIAVDAICGGFPCQDISTAGKGAGIGGERSGLWKEYARIIGELRPQLAIMENVSALLGRGLDVVLGDLAALRYDAEWHCIPASALGAPHRRDRIWIVAYAQHSGISLGRRITPSVEETGFQVGVSRHVRPRGEQQTQQVLAHPSGIGHEGPRVLTQWCGPEANGARQAAYALASSVGSEWATEPELGRVVNGIPDRAYRLKGLGNAVVPQIPELIGRAIGAALHLERAA